MSYPSVPPTSNTLHNVQRVRLMRSTRKLAEVLGTTPQVIELEMLPVSLLPIGPKPISQTQRRRPSISRDIKLQRRSARFYPAHSATSSLSSLENPFSINAMTVSLSMNNGSNTSLSSSDSESSPTKRPGSRKAVPRPLFLRLQSVPQSTQHNVATINAKSFTLSSPIISEPSTPTSPCMPLTPFTPTAAAGANSRRRKMAKLTRTLGENVPPELVFPVASAKPEPLCFVQHETYVDNDECDSPFDKEDEVEEYDIPYMGYGWTRELSMPSAHARRASEDNTCPPLTPLAARRGHARSKSHFLQHQDAFVYENSTVNVAPQPGQIPTRRSGFEDFGWDAYDSADGDHQRGRWQGDWNRGDMKQVRKGLRALKAR